MQKKIKNSLLAALSLEALFITKHGNHFEVIAVGDLFSGMSSLKRQQTIYAPLMKYITNKSIHAVSIKTYTVQEWKEFKKTSV
ncbi:BolA family protein [Candidatus Williamhamiltonella defendens]|uniref:BolA family protein n=1 Tax=Candidatus Williamhamiltonella defendens TaxID=138072 RepID=UPI00130D53DA|nr:BolA/IbaG family iron-sulfur metabolism protein [Candidatus Hamiltonella defensa]